MANNNVPTHDFAPAWLKIPTYDCHKPSGASLGGDSNNSSSHHHASRKDDHWVIRRERGEEPSIQYRYPFADSRWERESQSGDRKSSFFPSRHQSIDIDDGQYSSSSSSSGGSAPHTHPISSLSNSQPSLARRPSSRHDFRDSTYTKGGPSHYSEVNSNGILYNNKKAAILSQQNSDNRTNDAEGIDVTGNNFNQEFPSLKGKEEETKSESPCPINGSVWENPRNAKVHGVSRKVQLVHRPLKTDYKEGRSKSPSGLNGLSSCLSPKLNPSVSLISPPGKGNVGGGGVSNQSNNGGFRALIPAKRQTSPLNPPPQTMEILVKNPKMRGNKSEFLKTLRGEMAGVKNNHPTRNNDENGKSKEKLDNNHRETQSKNLDQSQDTKKNDREMIQITENRNEQNEHPAVNGIDINKLSVEDPLEKPLSSSLEAEQRLLREMGWKEDGSDDETYAPLTEDELKEFRDLSQKVASQRNGLQRNNFHLNWSPKRTPFTSVILPQPENWSSSSDSDSDSD